MLTLEEQNIILSSLPKNSRYKKYIKNGYTIEEAKILEKKNNKGYKEYWIERGYSEEDAKRKLKENNQRM